MVEVNDTIPLEEDFSRPKIIDEVNNLAEYNAFTLEKALQANEDAAKTTAATQKKIKDMGIISW